jgi:hypothetical protein
MDPFKEPELVKQLRAKVVELVQSPELLVKQGDLLRSNSTKTAKRKVEGILSEASEGRLHLNGDSAELVGVVALVEVFGQHRVDFLFGSTRFPDVSVDDSIGVEIKYIASGKETLGNSSVQTDPEMDEIYALVFTEADEPVLILYEDLITGVKVDHNPRFGLSLNSEGSFSEEFGLSLVEYFALSPEEKHKRIRQHLIERSTGRDWLWYLGNEDTEQIAVLLDKLKANWDSIDRDELRTRAFSVNLSCFRHSNYDELRRWVLETYDVIGPVKDVFTAGGKKPLYGSGAEVPAIFHRFSRLLPDIVNFIRNEGIDEHKWKEEAIEWIESKRNDARNQLEPETVDFLTNRIAAVTDQQD